jgi:uncharacterized protein YqgV (UPF0045/DUF77 family)|tara:strand:- start:155 stop:400 length:246 start_codon:yes stop_codon:yes gene_type:complete
MIIAVDISLYPLDENFIPPISDFISRLNEHPLLTVITNSMSTQIKGEYDLVMGILNQEIKETFKNHNKAIFAIKMLNNPIS